MANTSRLAFTGEISAEVDYELPEDPIYLGRFPVLRYTLTLNGVGDVSFGVDADVFVGAFGFLTAGAKAGLSFFSENRLWLLHNQQCDAAPTVCDSELLHISDGQAVDHVKGAHT